MKSAILAIATATAFVAAPAFAHGHKAKTETVQKSDIVDTAASAGMFETLLTAATAADLAGALKGDGPLTVFAPTDEAFVKLPEGTVASLLKPENKHQLVDILKYHVIAGAAVTSDQLAGAITPAETLNGKVIVDGTDGVRVGTANVIKADIKASNGVIHVIDTVLIPVS